MIPKISLFIQYSLHFEGFNFCSPSLSINDHQSLSKLSPTSIVCLSFSSTNPNLFFVFKFLPFWFQFLDCIVCNGILPWHWCCEQGICLIPLNERLSEEHKSFIVKIQFRWFLELNDNTKLGRNILNELLVRWVDSSGGFCFGEKVVEFKEIDVCLGTEKEWVSQVLWSWKTWFVVDIRFSVERTWKLAFITFL